MYKAIGLSISTFLLAFIFLLSPAVKAQTYTPAEIAAWCEANRPDSEFEVCYEERLAQYGYNPDGTIDPDAVSAWCEANRPDSEFEECYAERVSANVPSGGSGGSSSETVISPSIEENFNQQVNTNQDSNVIYERLNQIINFLSIGVGIVVTGSVVYAGIQWSISRGNPQATGQAINRLWSAGIALVLYVFMWVILNWLIPGGSLG